MPPCLPSTTDFLIVGGGIIGVNMAIELARRFSDGTVTLLEKEHDFGMHASGRNSGILHAGFYYTADSLKARLTRDGNRALTGYCLERGLDLNRCGKLVVAKNVDEVAGLEELYRRGLKNGVEVEIISSRAARQIEPRVKTVERALYSPTTSCVDPRQVLHARLDDARGAGVRLVAGCRWLGRKNGQVITSGGAVATGYVVNTAGVYAARIARAYGFSRNYRILPFKGLFLYSAERPGALRTTIYPVPDLADPFLGVHFTLTTDGRIKIGPTAIPAFWYEHYRGWENFHPMEFTEIIMREAGLFLRNDFAFRRLTLRELQKYSRRRLVRMAADLATGVHPEDYRRWGEPGIRAQLVDIRRRRLEMDFRFEGDARSFHVLNAVSPAFTCALPFSRYLCDKIEALINPSPFTVNRMSLKGKALTRAPNP